MGSSVRPLQLRLVVFASMPGACEPNPRKLREAPRLLHGSLPRGRERYEFCWTHKREVQWVKEHDQPLAFVVVQRNIDDFAVFCRRRCELWRCLSDDAHVPSPVWVRISRVYNVAPRTVQESGSKECKNANKTRVSAGKRRTKGSTRPEWPRPNSFFVRLYPRNANTLNSFVPSRPCSCSTTCLLNP